LDIELEFVLNHFGTYQNKQKLHILEHRINFYVPKEFCEVKLNDAHQKKVKLNDTRDKIGILNSL
jgi:hypothetical protein